MNTKIDRRQFMQVGATTLAASKVPLGLAEATMNKPMNVLYVIADQHQAACMGIEGHPQVITPNMDALAHRGVRFTSCYTQHPICTPSP